MCLVFPVIVMVLFTKFILWTELKRKHYQHHYDYDRKNQIPIRSFDIVYCFVFVTHLCEHSNAQK